MEAGSAESAGKRLARSFRQRWCSAKFVVAHTFYYLMLVKGAPKATSRRIVTRFAIVAAEQNSRSLAERRFGIQLFLVVSK
jgi:hypothetical protein